MSDDYITEAMSEMEAAIASGDRLTLVREALKELRGLLQDRTDLEEKLKEVNGKIRLISDQNLVKLFSEAHISNIGLDAEGNHPAYMAKRVPFYSARIPDDKAEEAFEWFQANGYGDLIKTTIVVALGMQERSTAKEVEDFLDEKAIDFSSKLAVHASTLTAFVRKMSEDGKEFPKDALGAFVGETVKFEPVVVKPGKRK